MSDEKKRIVIIEDHPMVRERLAQLVNKEADMEVCGEASDAQTGVDMIRSLAPDLAIVDVTLEGSSGLELIKTLRALANQIPILVLSMHDESQYAQRALRAGADGYITKNRASDEVIAAARKVMKGEVYLSPQMTSNLLRNMTPGRTEAASSRPEERLSERELEVFQMIGEGQGSRAIAETLKVGLPTVDTYRARIKEKLKLENAFQLQHFAIRWLRERE